MRIAVIGAGLLGVTTAWFLAESGNEVIVIDRNEGAGLETSFANGGMLTPSQAGPWNTPGIALQVLRWVGREESPLLLKPSQLFALAGWGTAFLRHSQLRRFRTNQLKNIALASYSLKVLRQTRSQLDIRYDQSSVGTMKIYRDSRTLEQAVNALVDCGAELRYQVLDPQGVIAREPTLAPIRRTLAGGIYFPDDEAGDAHQFCQHLARAAADLGARFMYGTRITSLDRSANYIKAVKTSAGDVRADMYILAAGSYSPLLARSAGLNLPIYPVKGYSLTVETAKVGTVLPTVPVIDELRHVAVTPLGKRLRIAGKAELAGYDTTIEAKRISLLLKYFGQIYPELGDQIDPGTIRTWTGLRPYCSDGVPIIGPCQIENLILNTGHGHLGWTLAAGSARLIADLVTGDKTALDLAPYLLSRFH
jgi:D-amino-acid dehydrogenase